MPLYSSKEITDFVKESVGKLKADPSAGTNHNKAITRVISNFLSEGKVRDHTFLSDEPPARGGTDQGPSPLEYFIAGFSLCQQVIFILYAARLGIDLDSLEIEADGVVPARGIHGFKGYKPGICEINYKIRVESKESKEKIIKLVDTVEKYCPAVNTLKEPPALNREIILNGKTIG